MGSSCSTTNGSCCAPQQQHAEPPAQPTTVQPADETPNPQRSDITFKAPAARKEAATEPTMGKPGQPAPTEDSQTPTAVSDDKVPVFAADEPVQRGGSDVTRAPVRHNSLEPLSVHGNTEILGGGLSPSWEHCASLPHLSRMANVDVPNLERTPSSESANNRDLQSKQGEQPVEPEVFGKIEKHSRSRAQTPKIDKQARLAARREATREQRRAKTEPIPEEDLNVDTASENVVNEEAVPCEEGPPAAAAEEAQVVAAKGEDTAPCEDDKLVSAHEKTCADDDAAAAPVEAPVEDTSTEAAPAPVEEPPPQPPQPAEPIPANKPIPTCTGSIQKVKMPKSQVELTIANVTIENVDLEMPSGKPNQDRLLVETELLGDKNQMFFGVFDGHGTTGHDCAQFAQENVLAALCDAPDFNNSNEWGIQKALHTAMIKVNTDMHQAEGVDDLMSGTTAISVLLRNGELCVANVGDSRAILLQGTGEGGSWVAKDLSQDHTPFREDELERVKAGGSQVITLDELEGLCGPRQPSEWTQEDPPRCYVPFCGYPGTGFTRSIGDAVAKNIGVVAAPEVLIHPITQIDQAFLLCSDGVTEFLSSQQIADILWHQRDDLLAAATTLAKEAQRLWIQELACTDDITIIVVQMSTAPPRRKSVTELPPPLAYTSLKGDWYSSPLVHLMKQTRAIGSASKCFSGRRHDEGSAVLSLLASLSETGLVREESFRAPFDSMSLCLGSNRHKFPILQKDKAQRVLLSKAITNTPLCHRMSEEQVEDLVDVMELVQVPKSGVVFQQGEQGEWFYVVQSGTFGVFDSNDAMIYQYVRQNEHSPLPSFGEMALMYGSVRQATVKAMEDDCSVWKLHKQSWLDQRRVGVFEVDTNTQSRSLVEPKEPAKQTPKTTAELAVLEQATMRAPLLGRLEPSHRTHLFNAMTSRTLEAGQVLYRQGDIADAMYVVQAGELAVAVERIQNSEEQELLYQYTALSCFGEQALISNHKRCSTVTAKSPCVLWVLDYNSFKTMIKLLMSFGG